MKVLIIKLSSLGDIVHAFPTVNAIKKAHPDWDIDWFVHKNFKELVSSQESINKIITLKDKKFSSYLKAIGELKKENYDIVIDLQGLIKTSLISFFAAGKKRIGFKEPREQIASLFYTDKVDAGKVFDCSKHIVEKNLLLAQYCIQNSQAIDIDSPDYGLNNWLNTDTLEAAPEDGSKKVCIIASTNWESKKWPSYNWSKLIYSFQYNWDPVMYMIGTKQDEEYLNEIISKTSPEIIESPKFINLIDQKRLKELPSFFREMDFIIGVDTGPLHLAAASVDPSKTKILAIHGPTSGRRTGPYGFDHISFDEISDEPASNKRTYEKDNNSICSIFVADVFRKSQELLGL